MCEVGSSEDKLLRGESGYSGERADEWLTEAGRLKGKSIMPQWLPAVERPGRKEGCPAGMKD